MERLMVMRLHAQGVAVEARINDIPLGRIGPKGGVMCLPVHEYLLEGENELSLVIAPRPPGTGRKSQIPAFAEQAVGARMLLLLPRMGQPADESQARTVAEVAWAAPEGDVYDTPLVTSQGVELPVKFPRWRWLDAPMIDDVEAHRALVAAFLQSIVVDLLKGEVESYLTASRLRLEELALAYQQPVATVTAKLRARLQLLHATKALKLSIPTPANLVLNRCAGRRLLECMTNDGKPILATAPGTDASACAWPVRLAVANGRCHILR